MYFGGVTYLTSIKKNYSDNRLQRLSTENSWRLKLKKNVSPFVSWFCHALNVFIKGLTVPTQTWTPKFWVLHNDCI